MSPDWLSIADIERDTGIGKDTLRVWERRYGFPCPERDGQGERRYDPPQLERLRLVRRLLDAGHRPAQVLPLDLEALQALSGQAPPSRRRRAAQQAAQRLAPAAAPDPAWLDAVRHHRVDDLRRGLQHHLLQHGLLATLDQAIGPLAAQVGAAWAAGELTVVQEHLFSEVVEAVLRETIASLAHAGGERRRPRVLLTTLPGEQHTLGLLMAEGALALQGCERLPLGPSTPIAEIAAAARRLEVDVVALGTSANAQARALRADLQRLRAGLPETTELWLGGPVRALLGRQPVPGVVPIERMAELPARIEAWRAARG